MHAYELCARPECARYFERRGEAEWYGLSTIGSEAIAMIGILRFFSFCPRPIGSFSDSSAARGIIHRAGLSKLRHLETGYLWLQAAVKAKKLQVRKVLGTENPADLLAKHLSAADMWKNLEKLHMIPEAGRSKAVPGIN